MGTSHERACPFTTKDASLCNNTVISVGRKQSRRKVPPYTSPTRLQSQSIRETAHKTGLPCDQQVDFSSATDRRSGWTRLWAENHRRWRTSLALTTTRPVVGRSVCRSVGWFCREALTTDVASILFPSIVLRVARKRHRTPVLIELLSRTYTTGK